MINKANLSIDGDDITLSLPIVKVNKEARTVSGFATLDNIDNQQDQVSAEASERAFSRWRGNVREMHQPIAAGRALDFKKRNFFDEKTGQEYQGMFVTTYISKGAESTWEKILDGTLTGFSIGGKALKKEDAINKDSGEKYTIIKDYQLNELSLVDSPCNQLANIMSIQKSDDGLIMKGMAADVKTENVLYCKDNGIAVLSESDADKCPECDGDLQNIGWVENTDDKQEVVKSLIAKHNEKDLVIKEDNFKLNSNGDAFFNGTTSSTTGGTIYFNSGSFNLEEVVSNAVRKEMQTLGGVDVAKEEEKVEKAEEVEETTEETEEVEKAAEVDETKATPSDLDVDALVEKFSASVSDAINAVKEETAETVEKSVGAVKGDFEEFSKNLNERLDGLDERLKSVEEGGAVQKSEDVTKVDNGEDLEKKDDNIWGGRFLSASELQRI